MNGLILAAALWAAAGAGAQKVEVRLPEVPRASSVRFTVQMPAMRQGFFAPSSGPEFRKPVLAPGIVVPSIPAPAVGIEAPPVAPASPSAIKAVTEMAEPPRTPEDAPRDAARRWEGSRSPRRDEAVSADSTPAVGDMGAARKLAAPYRTAVQLRLLRKSPRGPGEPFRFAVIGDAEPGRFWFSRALFNPERDAFWKLLGRADAAGHDFIMQLGDMVSRGLPSRFREFFARLRAAALRTPFLTVIGNHDRHKPHGVSNDRVYRSLFGRTDYSFERGGWRFAVVDTSDGRLSSAQREWLDRTLDPAVPTIVFTHMPPAPLGEWTNYGWKGSGGFKEGAEDFMRLMAERGVRRVYMGHVHALGVLDRGGVRYVLSGGGGSPLFPGPVKARLHHSLSVELRDGTIVETVLPLDGEPFVLR